MRLVFQNLSKSPLRSPINVVASKSRSFETVGTVQTGSYRRIVGREVERFQPLWLCRLEHQPLCSSPCQHDQHVTQLYGNVAKSAKSRMVAESLRRPSTCSKASASTRLRTAAAGTSTQTRRSLAPVVVELLQFSPFLSLHLTLSFTTPKPARICCVSVVLELFRTSRADPANFRRIARALNLLSNSRLCQGNTERQASMHNKLHVYCNGSCQQETHMCNSYAANHCCTSVTTSLHAHTYFCACVYVKYVFQRV